MQLAQVDAADARADDVYAPPPSRATRYRQPRQSVNIVNVVYIDYEYG